MKKIVQTSLFLLLLSCAKTQPPADTIHRRPGSWEALNYTMAFDATGVTGSMAEIVKAGQASIGQKDFGGPECLTLETTAKDDLMARIGEAMHFGPEGTITRATVSDRGKVDFAASMDDEVQGRGEMTITGVITPTTTDLLVTTDAFEPPPGKGHIHTVMKQENTRVGDCTASQ